MKNLSIIIAFCCFTSLLKAQSDEYLKEVILKCDYRTNCLDINEGESKLLVGGEDEKVRLYDLKTKKVLFETTAHFQPVVEVRFSNKNNAFYTVGDKSFKLWLEGEDKPNKIYTGSKTSITDWDLYDDETVFIAGAFEKKFRHWNASDLKTPTVFNTNQTKNVISIALHPDKKTVASGSYDKTIELWNMESESKLLKMDAHAKPVCCLDFSADGKQLISASHDGTAKLWDVESGTNLKTYTGHLKPISNIAISPNGHYLLTASYDNSINLYAITSGDLIYKYKHHKAAVLDVKWNNTGTEFYSCDKEGTILLWQLDPKVIVQYFYKIELNEEIRSRPIFDAKRKTESKKDYKVRQAKADAQLDKLISKYYQMYLSQLNHSSTESAQ